MTLAKFLIPEDISKSIFNALPRKTHVFKCELHCIISLLSHITKVILQVIMTRMLSNIRRCELAKSSVDLQQMWERGKATFILKMQGERTVNVKRNPLCLLPRLHQGFDKVRHRVMLEMLQNLGLDRKNTQLIWNLYWEQPAAIRTVNEIS